MPYCELLKFLNWEDNPAAVAKPTAIKVRKCPLKLSFPFLKFTLIQCVLEWILPQPPLKILCVNYRAFLDDVCPNIKCALPALVCCCNENKPCPQHPSTCKAEFLPDEDGYCPQEKSEEPKMEECPPQEPITIHVKPCFIKPTAGKTHKCAPGANKCFSSAYENGEETQATAKFCIGEAGDSNTC